MTTCGEADSAPHRLRDIPCRQIGSRCSRRQPMPQGRNAASRLTNRWELGTGLRRRRTEHDKEGWQQPRYPVDEEVLQIDTAGFDQLAMKPATDHVAGQHDKQHGGTTKLLDVATESHARSALVHHRVIVDWLVENALTHCNSDQPIYLGSLTDTRVGNDVGDSTVAWRRSLPVHTGVDTQRTSWCELFLPNSDFRKSRNDPNVRGRTDRNKGALFTATPTCRYESYLWLALIK